MIHAQLAVACLTCNGHPFSMSHTLNALKLRGLKTANSLPDITTAGCSFRCYTIYKLQSAMKSSKAHVRLPCVLHSVPVHGVGAHTVSVHTFHETQRDRYVVDP